VSVIGPEFAPTWLDPDDVREWLTANQQPSSDIVGIDRVCAMTELHVQRCRPDQYVDQPPDPDGDPVPAIYVPDAEVYQGAVMYAARECRRRNNPTGTETFDGGLTFIARYDPDIDRALRTGAYQLPGVG